MSSSHGQDASRNALQAAYDSIHVKVSPSYAERLTTDIGRNLRSMSRYRNAKLILGYRHAGEEMDARTFLEQAFEDGKLVAMPRLLGSVIKFFLVKDPKELGSDKYDETAGIEEYDLDNSVCLVPGLVFDAEGYRVSYGAGFLDNFLRDYPGLKVGVARGFNISSNPLPHAICDVPVDVLVSESAVWTCRR